MTGHAPDHVMTTPIGTEHSPLTADAAREDALAGEDLNTDSSN